MGTDVAGTGLPWVEAIAQSFEPYSFVAFHRAELPALVAQHGHLVVDDLRGVSPLAFLADGGRSFTWLPTGRGIDVIEGDADAPTLVELSERTFSEFLPRVAHRVGRGARTGRAQVHTRHPGVVAALGAGHTVSLLPAAPSTAPRCGRPWSTGRMPLDLHHAFSAGDDPEAMRHFLERAGYLHIKAVFTAARGGTAWRRGRTRASAHHARRPLLVVVDQRRRRRGRHPHQLPRTALGAARRTLLRRAARALRAARRLRPAGLRRPPRTGRWCSSRTPTSCKGNGDLGWHVDDGIGGRPVSCPSSRPASSSRPCQPGERTVARARRLPPLHQALVHVAGAEADLPVVTLETEPGDLTLHYGDTMHTTPPPTASGAGRRALYFKFAEPKTFAWVPRRLPLQRRALPRQPPTAALRAGPPRGRTPTRTDAAPARPSPTA